MEQKEQPATMEDILAQHRRERKDLQAKIQEMKKNAPKSDKKKRKEAMEHILQLEHELEHRQAEELKAAHAKSDAEEKEQQHVDTEAVADANPAGANDNPHHDNENDVEKTDAPNAQRVTKAQKRRDKKAREACELQERVLAAAADAHNSPKAIEERQICELLNKCHLSTHSILSDGNCLYNSVCHQLQLHGVGVYRADDLRNTTADHMLDNKDSYSSYLDGTDYASYCESIRNPSKWGGQIELNALSRIYGVPIKVLQAAGPPILLGSNEKGPQLIITYHRHMYTLGEHFNSTQPRKTNAKDDDDI